MIQNYFIWSVIIDFIYDINRPSRVIGIYFCILTFCFVWLITKGSWLFENVYVKIWVFFKFFVRFNKSEINETIKYFLVKFWFICQRMNLPLGSIQWVQRLSNFFSFSRKIYPLEALWVSVSVIYKFFR